MAWPPVAPGVLRGDRTRLGRRWTCRSASSRFRCYKGCGMRAPSWCPLPGARRPIDRRAQAEVPSAQRSDTPPSAAAAAPRSIRDRITIRNDELDAGRPLSGDTSPAAWPRASTTRFDRLLNRRGKALLAFGQDFLEFLFQTGDNGGRLVGAIGQ